MGALRSRSLHLVVVTASASDPPAELTQESEQHPDTAVTSETPDQVHNQLAEESDARIDCMLVPQEIGERDGVAFVESVRDHYPDVPIILFVESDRGDIVPRAFDAGVTETLPRSTLDTRPDAVIDRVETIVTNDGSVRSPTRLEEEREKYATLVEQSSDAIVVVQDRQYVFVNERFCELTGYDRDELLGMPFDEVFTPEYRELVKQRYRERVAGESPPRRYDVEIETTGGEVRTLDLAVSRIQHEGEPATMANFRDVTDQRELEQTYREVFEGVSDGLVVHDPDTGEMLRVNEQFCELTGYDRDELIGETVDLINPPDYTYDDAQERIERAREEGSLLFEWRNQRKSGETHPIEVHLRTVRIRGEERVLASVRDITERKRREREYEQIFNGVNDIVNVYDPDTGDLVAVNDTMCEVTGYDREALLDAGVELVSATDEGYTADRAAEVIGEVIESGEPRSLDWRIETADGDRRWLDVRATPATVGGEDRVLTISRDVTERRRTERRLEAILDRIDEAIFLAEASELDEPSPAPDYLSSGYEEIWGQPLEGLHETYDEGFFGTLHPDDAAGYRAFIDDILADIEADSPEDRYTREYRIERPDGEVRWVHSDFYPLDWPSGEPRIVILSRDITDRKRRERRMASFEEATDGLTMADTPTEAARTAIDAATETLGLPAVAAFFYDEATGDLTAEAVSEPLTDIIGPEAVDSGEGPLWEAFATGCVATPDDGDPRIVEDGEELTDWRAIALGSHGVLLVGSCGDAIDPDTIQSAHVLAATLEAALNHLRSEEQLAAQQAELETQTERAERLERVAQLTQQVEKAITEASTRRGIEASVCDQLAE
ncbi:MAG: PAS domain S-box-containing protein, partial [Natronomonas sp.]